MAVGSVDAADAGLADLPGQGVQAGQRVDRSQPQKDDAPFYPGKSPGAGYWSDVAGRNVGTFAFSQWGGPSGSEGANGDVGSVDVAAIDVTNTNLTLRPLVTDWKSVASGDLSTSAIKVTAIGDARVGDKIVRSGRTTGMQAGTVLEVKSWTKVCEKVTPTPVGCHWVYGFRTNAVARPGDSGGAFLRGTTAIGGSGGVSDTGTGAPQNKTVFASIPAGTTLPAPGTYTDTVVITVTY